MGASASTEQPDAPPSRTGTPTLSTYTNGSGSDTPPRSSRNNNAVGNAYALDELQRVREERAKGLVKRKGERERSQSQLDRGDSYDRPVRSKNKKSSSFYECSEVPPSSNSTPTGTPSSHRNRISNAQSLVMPPSSSSSSININSTNSNVRDRERERTPSSASNNDFRTPMRRNKPNPPITSYSSNMSARSKGSFVNIDVSPDSSDGDKDKDYTVDRDYPSRKKFQVTNAASNISSISNTGSIGSNYMASKLRSGGSFVANANSVSPSKSKTMVSGGGRESKLADSSDFSDDSSSDDHDSDSSYDGGHPYSSSKKKNTNKNNKLNGRSPRTPAKSTTTFTNDEFTPSDINPDDPQAALYHKQMKSTIRQTVLEKKILAKTKQLMKAKEYAEGEVVSQKGRADAAEQELKRLRGELERFKESNGSSASVVVNNNQTNTINDKFKRPSPLKIHNIQSQLSVNVNVNKDISSDESGDDNDANTFSKPLKPRPPGKNKNKNNRGMVGVGKADSASSQSSSTPNTTVHLKKDYSEELRAHLNLSSSEEDDENDNNNCEKNRIALPSSISKIQQQQQQQQPTTPSKFTQSPTLPHTNSYRKPPPPKSVKPSSNTPPSSSSLNKLHIGSGRGVSAPTPNSSSNGSGKPASPSVTTLSSSPPSSSSPSSSSPALPKIGSKMNVSTPERKPSATHTENSDDSADYGDDDEIGALGDGDEDVYDWTMFDTAAGLDGVDEKKPVKSSNKGRDMPIPKTIMSDSDEDSDEEVVGMSGDGEEVYDWTMFNTDAGLKDANDGKSTVKVSKDNANSVDSSPSSITSAATAIAKGSGKGSGSSQPPTPTPQGGRGNGSSQPPTPTNYGNGTPGPGIPIAKALSRGTSTSPSSSAAAAASASTPTSGPVTPTNDYSPTNKTPASRIKTPPIVEKALSNNSTNNSSFSSMLNSAEAHSVKDTNKVKRKKASLPSNMPNQMGGGVHGSWLTNRYIVNNYILLDPLGQGSYAEVRLCKEKTEDQLYAIKIMNKDLLMKKSVGMSSTFMDDVKREIAIMKKLRHENILRLYEVLDDPKVNKMYLVLEYMKNGDLMQMTKGNARTNTCNPLTDLQVWDVMRQVLRGLKYLHDNNIVHGDIKPQNLLVSDAGVIKIADFGISKMIDTSDGEKEKLLETAGTPAFMSPELCSGLAYDGNLADVYAVGATIFMLRCGHPPFVANKLITLYNKIQSDPVVFTCPVASGLKRLIQGMMEKEPGKRLSLAEVTRDPWLQFKPDGEIARSGSGNSPKSLVDASMVEKFSKVSVSNDEIFKSVHQVNIVPTKGTKKVGPKPPPPDSSGGPLEGKTMASDEQERRMKAFQKKASLSKPGSFNKLGAAKAVGNGNPIGSGGVGGGGARGGESGSSSSDDDGDEELLEDGGYDDTTMPVRRLDSTQFDTVMDTLAHQPSKTFMKKQAPIPNLTLLPITDGLANEDCKIRASFHSEQGKRPNQEDRVTVILDLSVLGSHILPRPYLYGKFGFFGIYDGHGGERCADMLQLGYHERLCQDPDFFTDSPQALISSCKDEDERICEDLREDDDSSGSTGLMVIVNGRAQEFIVGHVGDSRCVLSRGGTAVELTRDHRLDREDERERVERMGGYIRDKRVNGVLAVTRSFGDVQHKPNRSGGGGKEEHSNPVSSSPEVRVEKIKAKDEFIVLATDGLWDMMASQQVVNFVRLQLCKSGSVKSAARELVKEAVRGGSADNVSVVVVCFNQEVGIDEEEEEKEGGNERRGEEKK